MKISADDDVAEGLHVAEGIETAVACLGMGFRPMWVALSAGGIANFPILSGVEALTIFADHDRAGMRSATTCAARWTHVGKEVTIAKPIVPGADFADRGAR